MIWLVFIGLMACVLALMFLIWRDFSQETEGYPRAWFIGWLCRGVAFPVFLWFLMNLGSMPIMPSLTHEIGVARGKGAWGHALLEQTCLAAMEIVSYWTVLTCAWFLVGFFKRARNKEDMVTAMVIWTPVLLLLEWVCWVGGGWGGIGAGLLFWILPLTHYVQKIVDTKPPPPTYSQAIAKMKFGKYSDAEMAIIAQLEQCETDFDGWMMLADLYANQFHDVAEAEKTICELCDEPTITLPQVSVALHRLADWQLHLRGDPASAKRVLEEICRRMPGTHLATMARHRINQLPHSVRELEEQQKPKTVIMPAWSEELDSAKPSAPMNKDEALAMANRLVDQLKMDPNDIFAREKLARVFAGPLGQVNLALEQLELLLGMPGQTAAKIAEWLGLMGAWLIEQQGECEAAQRILERLVHEFPQTPQAFAAQRRLILMQVKPVGAKSARTNPGQD